MATFPEGHLVDLVTADATITGIIGSRFYKDVAPQGEANPCATFTRIQTDRVRTQKGPDGLAQVVIQISCFADDALGAINLADKFRQLLNGVEDSFFLGTAITEEFSTDPFYSPGEESPTYQQVLTLLAHYRDVTP